MDLHEVQKIRTYLFRHKLILYFIIGFCALLTYLLIIISEQISTENKLQSSSDAAYFDPGTSGLLKPIDKIYYPDSASSEQSSCSNLSIVPDKYGPLGCFWIQGYFQIRVNCGNGLKVIPKKRIREVFSNEARCIPNYGSEYEKLKKLAQETCGCDDTCPEKCFVAEEFSGFNATDQCDPGNGERGSTLWHTNCGICSPFSTHAYGAGISLDQESTRYHQKCIPESVARAHSERLCKRPETELEDFTDAVSRPGYLCKSNPTPLQVNSCFWYENIHRLLTKVNGVIKEPDTCICNVDQSQCCIKNNASSTSNLCNK